MSPLRARVDKSVRKGASMAPMPCCPEMRRPVTSDRCLALIGISTLGSISTSMANSLLNMSWYGSLVS